MHAFVLRLRERKGVCGSAGGRADCTCARACVRACLLVCLCACVLCACVFRSGGGLSLSLSLSTQHATHLILLLISATSRPPKGSCLENISFSITPNAYTSLGSEHASPRNSSGAIYPGVPAAACSQEEGMWEEGMWEGGGMVGGGKNALWWRGRGKYLRSQTSVHGNA